MATRGITSILTLLCSLSIVLGQNYNCPLDLVFVMDTSGGAINAGASQPLKDFMYQITNQLPASSRVGVIAFGDYAQNLMSWSTRSQNTLNSIQNLQIPNLSATNTDTALTMAKTDFFDARTGVKNPPLAILVSEGPSAGSKLQRYRDACQQLKNIGVRVMVIGVLVNGIQSSAFTELNCHWDNTYSKSVNSYSDLYTMQSQVPGLANPMCSGTVNACTSRPCQNGGTCTTNGNSFQCQCASGWTGQTCSQVVSPCSSNPCRNGGTCFRSGNGFQCSCPTGYSGTTCQQQVDPCMSNPCRNGGFCRRQNNGYSCTCQSSWTGRNCENQLGNPCGVNPCRNGGTCFPLDSTNFYCVCRSGFSGPDCMQGQGQCSSMNCINGQCMNGRCSCFTGWSGNRCDISTQGNACSPNPCMNGGTCMASGNSYRCNCNSRYTGERCDRIVQTDTDVNEVFLARFEQNDRFGEMRNENGGRDQLDWKTTNGKKKPMMGPTKDASEDNSRGNYAYIMYDRNTDFSGKFARYITQPIQSTGAMCLEFKYWMTGGWDKIRILVKRTNGQVIGVGEFKGKGENYMWVLGQVNLDERASGSEVIIEAHPYLDYSQGDNLIAADHINIMDGGYCQPKPKMEGYYYRIVGGPTPFEGRVEVSRWNTTDPSMWGGLCMNGFGTLEAQMICAKLFPGSEQVLGFRPGRTISLPDYGNPAEMVQDNINCMGKDSLDECITSGWKETSCTLSESAKVRCDQPEFYYVGNELRLADYVLNENDKTFTGRVELFYNGEWGTVCSNGFDQNDAQTVCNTIGFTGPARANLNGANGQGTGRVFLENVNCPRDAREFTQCLSGQTWASRCSHTQDVGVTCTFEPKNMPWNCDFENSNNNCNFNPYSMNAFEWMVGRPPIGSPRGSRTMYTSLSAENPNNVMSIDSMYDYSAWISPMFEAFPTTDFVCIRFWYYATGIRDVQGSDSVFSVMLKMGRNSYPKFWLDSRDIGVDGRWTEAYFTISDASAPFKLKFIAKKLVPAGRQSYIMVDDIRVTEGSCSGEGYITDPGTGPGTPSGTPPPPTTGGSCNSVMKNENALFRCEFEDNDPACASRLTQQGNNNQFQDWLRRQDGTRSSGTGPNEGNNGRGYVHLEASNINDGAIAVARFNGMLDAGSEYCLAFDYHMMGPNIDTLRIGYSSNQRFSDIPDNDRNRIALFEIQGSQGDQWNAQQVDIKTRNIGTGYMYLLAERGNGYQGDISLDNVQLRRGECCPSVCASSLTRNQDDSIYNCDFQGQYEGCCFRNCPSAAPMDNTNQVYRATCGASSPFNYAQWSRTRRGNSNDYFLASNSSTNARLYTGMIDLQGGVVCMRMRTQFTSDRAELSAGILNSNPVMTVRNPRNLNNWEDRTVTIQGGNMVQLVIEGRNGVFIDDLRLENGRC